MPTLQRLLDTIREGKLLPATMFDRDDRDDLLDQRDAEEFERPWLACYNRIKEEWSAREPEQAATALMDEIRKESFLAVSRATRQHEMASYVSDDFELIAKSIALDLNDEYANGLLETYEQGEIPK